MLPFTVHPVGDSALLAAFEQRIAPDIGAAVAALNARVQAAGLPGVVETVPAFASLMMTYDPLVTDYDDAGRRLATAGCRPRRRRCAAGEGRLVTIPVCYGGDVRPRPALCGRARGADRNRGHPSCTPGGITRSICWGFCRAFPIWVGWMSGCLPRVWPRRALRSRQGRWASAVSRRAFTPSPARAAGS